MKNQQNKVAAPKKFAEEVPVPSFNNHSFEVLQDPEQYENTPLDETPKENQGNLAMLWENEEKAP